MLVQYKILPKDSKPVTLSPRTLSTPKSETKHYVLYGFYSKTLVTREVDLWTDIGKGSTTFTTTKRKPKVKSADEFMLESTQILPAYISVFVENS